MWGAGPIAGDQSTGQTSHPAWDLRGSGEVGRLPALPPSAEGTADRGVHPQSPSLSPVALVSSDKTVKEPC